jgi:hypothetical protein
MTPFDFLCHANIFGFGLRTITSAFVVRDDRHDDFARAGRDDTRRGQPYLRQSAPTFWILHGR